MKSFPPFHKREKNMNDWLRRERTEGGKCTLTQSPLILPFNYSHQQHPVSWAEESQRHCNYCSASFSRRTRILHAAVWLSLMVITSALSVYCMWTYRGAALNKGILSERSFYFVISFATCNGGYLLCTKEKRKIRASKGGIKKPKTSKRANHFQKIPPHILKLSSSTFLFTLCRPLYFTVFVFLPWLAPLFQLLILYTC